MTGRPEILIIDAWLPTPDRDAASVRMVNLVKIMRELSCEVTFAADDRSPRPRSVALLQALGVDVLDDPATSIHQYLEAEAGGYDLVILSRVHVAKLYMSEVRQFAPGAKIVFDTTDLAFLRGFRGAKVTGNASLLRQAMEAKRDEIELAGAADCTVVVSSVEKTVLEKECPGARVQVVSVIHEVQGVERGFEGRQDILFVGAFPHHPNADAMRYFRDDIYPIVTERLDTARIFVIGSEPPAWLKEASSERLVVTGYVPDLASYLNRCKLTIAPLRYGAGIKGKVLQSMSYGVPVVASSVAAEGIPAVDGRDILIGDDPQSFADAVARLYDDESVWNRLSQGGLNVVSEHFSFAAGRAQLLELFAVLGLTWEEGPE